MKMPIKSISFVILILVLIDTSYSFFQHYNQPLDGDIAGGIVPDKFVKQILEHPLGLEAFTSDTSYPNPNKFFSHWIFYKYFNTIPILLQNYTDPINSVYLSSAIFKTLIQVLLVMLLAFATSLITRQKGHFLLAMLFIIPFLQTNGFSKVMAVIDKSITYTFFYALPFLLLLLYLLPFYLKNYADYRIRLYKIFYLIWIPFSILVSLSGPLNPGVSLIICFMILIQLIMNYRKENLESGIIPLDFIKKVPIDYWFCLLPLAVFSFYSLLLGTHNSLNINNDQSIFELYKKLPIGLFRAFTIRVAFPLLILITGINIFLIRKNYYDSTGKRIYQTMKWIAIFSLLYFILLPLGGYRSYRPYIIRYDTMMPVTILIIYLFALTSIFLLNKLKGIGKVFLVLIQITVLVIFTSEDKPEFYKNDCERLALQHIMNSNEKVIELQYPCTVLEWLTSINPMKSKLNSILLYRWNIADEDVLYYHNLSEEVDWHQ